MTTTDPLVPPLVPPPRRTNRNLWILYALVVALLLMVALGGPLLLSRTSDSDQRAKHAEKVAQANQRALQSANACIRISCGVPVPTPSTTSTSGARGTRGPGPTQAQIDAAVNDYCSFRNDCIGIPSRAQVAAAVRAFCSAGACRGTRGARGPSGSPGASGAAGDTGPGPSDQEISDAVTAYCAAHGNCTGPAGPKGDTGDPGAAGAAGSPGRGIASVDCTGLGIDQLVIHFDDGTTQTVPCTTPTPTPSGAPTS